MSISLYNNRLDNKESCDKTIEMLNGTTLPDSNEPLMVKFADSSSNKKRQHAAGGCGFMISGCGLFNLFLCMSLGRWRDIGDVSLISIYYVCMYVILSCLVCI